MAEITSADRIVMALAETEPNADTGDMTHECVLCHVRLPVVPQDHAEDCPWRLAVEWVQRSEQAIVDYLTRELPEMQPRLGIARDILLALDGAHS